MHPVQEALNDAKRDEAADVDVGEFLAVLRIPLLDALALSQTRVELDNAYPVHDLPLAARRLAGAVPDKRPDVVAVVSMASGRIAGHVTAKAGDARGSGTGWGHGDRTRGKAHVNVTGAFPLHAFIACNCRAELRGGGIDGGEGENVQEEDASVVQEMLDRTVCKRELDVCENRDDADAVHTINIWDDLDADMSVRLSNFMIRETFSRARYLAWETGGNSLLSAW